MTHHDKETKDKGPTSKDIEDSQRGVRDTSGVNQGAQAKDLPIPEDSGTAKIPDSTIKKLQDNVTEDGQIKTSKRGRGAKGKGKGGGIGGGNPKVVSELLRIKDQVKCSFCGQFLKDVGGTPTVVPVTGRKIPKNAKGQYRFKSPGAEGEGKMVGVLCEMCAAGAATSTNPQAVDIKTVVAVQEDGTVTNIPLRDIIASTS